MPDPVSWLLIEPGWKVVAADGEDIGKVEEVAGDSTHDIWDGIAVASGILSKPRYVPAEQVAEIVEGEVRLALTKEQFEHLDEFQEPPTTARIESAGASLGDRAVGAVEGPLQERPESVPLVRRMLRWLGIKPD
jgi:hypothetical protein